MKPIDIQTNILQMSNAMKEISKQKQGNLHQLSFAASVSEKEHLKKENTVEEVDKIEATVGPLENELKDERGKKFKKNEAEKRKKEESEKKKSLFQDPDKGYFIDIKE